MSSGTYTLTANAQDDRNLSVTSTPVTVKISKALRGVRNSKRNNDTITSSISGSSPSASSSSTSTSDLLDTLTLDVEQTYRDFSEERSMFEAAGQIENFLHASLFLVRSSGALSKSSNSTSGISNRLKKVNAYLSFCEDLMVQNSFSASTLAAGARVNAWTKLDIGMPETKPQSASFALLLPSGVGRVMSTSPLTPLTLQTASVPGNQVAYELGGVTVSINGKAAALTAVSPTAITFVVPSTVVGGLGDVIVTAQDGYISHGTSAIFGLNPTIFADFLTLNGRGALINGLTIGSQIYATTATTLSRTDNRTRLAIWATGLSTGLGNPNSDNDVSLPNGGVLANLAESVLVEARTSNGTVFNLPVEFAGTTGILPGLDQINVVLRPELAGAGTVQLTVVAAGLRGNTATVLIR